MVPPLPMPPPKTLNCPKPTSSSKTSTMLGAPLGGRTIWGKVAGSESSTVRPTAPLQWKSGRGKVSVPYGGEAHPSCASAASIATRPTSARVTTSARVVFFMSLEARVNERRLGR